MSQCSRCGKLLSNKITLVRHLHAKNPCKPLFSDTSREQCLRDLSVYKNKPMHKCGYCKKNFSRKDSLARHQKLCKAPSNNLDKDSINSGIVQNIQNIQNNNSNNVINTNLYTLSVKP